MRTVISVISLCLALCWSAQAQQNIVGSGVYGDAKTTSAYTGPGDIVAYTAWYGFRAYNAAKANAGANVAIFRRSSDSTTCTGVLVASGALDLVGTYCSGSTNLSTFCANAAGSCFITTLFDQTAGNKCGGAACDIVQTTAANQPPAIFSCLGTFVCYDLTAGTIGLVSANNFTPSTAVQTITAVGNRIDTAAINEGLLASNGSGNNRLGTASGGTTWTIKGGTSGTITSGALTSNAFHVANGVFNGASSVLNTDGTDVTGTVTANTTAGAPQSIAAAGATHERVLEVGFIDNVALTSGQRTSLCHNAFTYWGTATSC
jgi:hypothetical protein